MSHARVNLQHQRFERASFDCCFCLSVSCVLPSSLFPSPRAAKGEKAKSRQQQQQQRREEATVADMRGNLKQRAIAGGTRWVQLLALPAPFACVSRRVRLRRAAADGSRRITAAAVAQASSEGEEER